MNQLNICNILIILPLVQRYHLSKEARDCCEHIFLERWAFETLFTSVLYVIVCIHNFPGRTRFVHPCSG